MTETAQSLTAQSFRGPIYDRALRIAQEKGFKMVSEAHVYIRDAPEEDALFTRKERKTIIAAAHQMLGTLADPKPKLLPARANAGASAQATTTAQTNTTTQARTFTFPSGTTFQGNSWQRDALEWTKDGIVAQIRGYLLDRALGVPVGVACHRDRVLHFNDAIKEGDRLWRLCGDSDESITALADAYAVRLDGTVGLPIDAEAQAVVAREVALMKASMAVMRNCIFAIDAINVQQRDRANAIAAKAQAAKAAVQEVVADGTLVAAG